MIEIIETFTKHSKDTESYEIVIKRDGETITSMAASDHLNECPEDAVLCRDLNFIYEAEDFFKIGYEAGKNNEEVICKKVYLNDDEVEITEEQYAAL